MEYGLKIPVEVYGQAQLKQLLEAIRGVGGATKGLSADMLDYVRRAREEVETNLSLQKGLDSLRRAKVGVTDEYKRLSTQLELYIIKSKEAEASTGRLQNVFGRLGGRIAGADIGSAAGIPGLGRVGGSIIGSSGLGGAAMLGIGAGVIGATLLEHAAERAREVQQLANSLGVAADQANRLAISGEFAYVKLGTLVSAGEHLATALEAPAGAGKKTIETLERLGVTLGDANGKLRPTGAILDDLVSKLAAIDDPAKRFATSMDAIGAAAKTLDAKDIEKWKAFADAIKPDPGTEKFYLAIADRIHAIGITMKENPIEGLGVAMGLTNPRTAALKQKLPFDPADIAPRQAFTNESDRLKTFLGRIVDPDTLSQATSEKKKAYDTARATAQAQIVNNPSLTPEARQRLQNDVTKTGGEYNAAKSAEEAFNKNSSRRREQLDSLKRMLETPPADSKELLSRLGKLNSKEFDAITGDPLFIKVRRSYAQQAVGAGGAFAKLGQRGFGDDDQLYSEGRKYSSGIISKEAAEFQGGLGRERSSLQEEGRSNESDYLARTKLEGAARAGRLSASRYTQSPITYAREQLRSQLGEIQTEADVRNAPIQGRIDYFGQHKGDLDENQKRELDSALAEKDRNEIDAKTKSIEVVNKFNEAIEESAQKLKQHFSEGFASLVMGAQNGGSKGVLDSIKSSFTGVEHTILTNIGGMLWSGKDGKSGIGGMIPHAQDSNSTLGKILQGTAFGAKPEQATVQLNDSTLKLVSAEEGTQRALNSLTSRLGGTIPSGTAGTGGGGEAASGTAALSFPFAGGSSMPGDNGTVPLAFPFSGSNAYSDVAATGSAISSIAGPIAQAAGAGGMAGVLKAVGGDVSKFGSALSGIGSTHSNVFESLIDGTGKSTSTVANRLGAATAIAGAGLGAYQGISTMTRGGAKNVSGGLAETLGAIAPLTGPAAPFVAAAAAAAGLISALLPDLRTQRANQISKTMFTQQYMAPQAQNITASGNGGYSDVDMFGNVRTSNLSPYPVVSNSYLDVPRRTVVPGHQVGQYGGYSNVTGAQVPQNIPPIMIQVQTLDSRSFNDNAGRIMDAMNIGLNQGHHELVDNLARKLGTR